MKTKFFFLPLALISALAAASCEPLQPLPDSFTVTEDKPAAPTDVFLLKFPSSYQVCFYPSKDCVRYFFFARSTVNRTMTEFIPVYEGITYYQTSIVYYKYSLTPQEFAELPLDPNDPYQIGVCGVSYKGVYSDIAWSPVIQP